MVTSTTDTTKKKTTTEDPAQTSQNTTAQAQVDATANQGQANASVGGTTAPTNTADNASGTVVGQQSATAPAATTPEKKNYITADYITNFYQQMQDQSAAMNKYTVDQAVQELQRTQEDAQAGFRQQQNQVNVDEAQARDAHVLYAAARGDRGGITARQYDSIANTAAKNRQGIQTAQQKLATDTARQIADLRARGEFEQANNVLQIAQQQLAQLWQLQHEEADNAAREKQFALQEANLTGKYNGEKTYAAQEAERSWAYDIAMQSIRMGIVPDESVMTAAGIDAEQAKLMAYIYAQTTGNQEYLNQYNLQQNVQNGLGGLVGQGGLSSGLSGLGGLLGGLFGGGTSSSTGSNRGSSSGSGSTVRVQGAGHGGSSEVEFDPNVDYQALINEAVAKGDVAAAAKYEDQRNAKIAAMNNAGTNTENYKKTNKYSENTVLYDANTDYQALINDAVAKGDLAAAEKYEQQRNAKIKDMNKEGTNTGGYEKSYNYTDTGYAYGGVSYDPDTDYQALINQAVIEGDYEAAAKYEKQRNAKINAMSDKKKEKAGVQTTNIYSSGTGASFQGVSFDPSVDYQALINQAVAEGDYSAAMRYERQRNAKLGAMQAQGIDTGGQQPTHIYRNTGAVYDGVSFDPNENYQALIEDAIANNDTAAATVYEQIRNAKVGALNALGQNIKNYLATNVFTGDGSQSDPVAKPEPAPYTGGPTTMSDEEFAVWMNALSNVENSAVGWANAIQLYSDFLSQGTSTAAQNAEAEKIKQMVEAELRRVSGNKK